MKVATYYSNQDIKIEERNVPEIYPGELLVKLRAASICGSDVLEWYRAGKGPRVLGHEVSGEIVKVGPGVENYKMGDRIAASHHVPCYECHFCKLGHHTMCDTLQKTNFDPGGFSELIRLPAINVRYGVYELPANVSYEMGTFVEPLACTIRAQRKAQVQTGQTVLVIGCGIAGLLHIVLAQINSMKRIIALDVNDYRLNVAKEFGAHFSLKPSSSLVDQIRSVNEGRLADVVLVCAGSKGLAELALTYVERGGTVLFFALSPPDEIMNLPMHEVFWKKGATLMSSYAASPEDHRESLELIRLGKIQPEKMISHRLGLSEVGKGFSIVSEAKNSLKVIIDPAR